ncbi:MAG: type I-E CRISPR-associated protein Cas7/Cse4/CasC [Terriglobia bacterium]|jgi:CRISPR system Cascade subunit CasC
MKLIELHILQSFPVSCLNRDEVGAPKSATFGGAPRARISSQCLKRAIRLYAAELQPKLYAANRSRLFTAEITKLLSEHVPNEAEALAKCAAHYLGKLDPKDNARVKTLMFLSPEEYQRLAKLLAGLSANDRKELCEAVAKTSPEELEKAEVEEEEDAEETKEEKRFPKTKGKDKPLTAKQFTKKVSGILKSPIKKEFGQGFVKDAADIAIFGRMVASDHSLTIEGAGLFSHALSTHKAENDIDFFSAVDDLQPQEEAGAGMTGTLEFNSATYYRYAALNLDLLFYQKDKDGKPSATLGCFAGEEHKAARRDIVDAFIHGVVLGMPGARKNSMNAHTLPDYVLGLAKDKGQPLQLINAFENPVRSENGLMEASIAKLKEYHQQLKKTWGIKLSAEIAIPDKPLDEFCEEILRHV